MPSILLLFSLLSCVSTQTRFYEAMRLNKHFDLSDLSNEELLIPQCSGMECVEKYTLIQAAIDEEQFYEATEKAISLFDLDVSGVRDIIIVDKIIEETPETKNAQEEEEEEEETEEKITVANASLALQITLSHAAFSSAPYLVIVLIHELGHIHNCHKYLDLIKRISGIDPNVSNKDLITIFQSLAQDKEQEVRGQYVKNVPHLAGLFHEERLVSNNIDITANQFNRFINILPIYSKMHQELFHAFEEADACLFTLKHRHRLFLNLESHPVQSQLSYLKRSLLEGATQTQLKLAIKYNLTKALREAQALMSADEQEKFEAALLIQMKDEMTELTAYLQNFGF